MFKITHHRGFHMIFQNGWTASVQWGPGNYCGHRATENFDAPKSADFWTSETAEVAAWPHNGDLVQLDNGNTVRGYLSADKVLDFLIWVRSQAPVQD